MPPKRATAARTKPSTTPVPTQKKQLPTPAVETPKSTPKKQAGKSFLINTSSPHPVEKKGRGGPRSRKNGVAITTAAKARAVKQKLAEVEETVVSQSSSSETRKRKRAQTETAPETPANQRQRTSLTGPPSKPTTPKPGHSRKPSAVSTDHDHELPPSTLLDKRYRILSTLGAGQFSRTYLCTDLSSLSNPHIALKRVSLPFTNLGVTEVDILTTLTDSSHIVNLQRSFMQDGRLHLVLEVLAPDRELALPECECPGATHEPIACPIRHKVLAAIMTQLLAALSQLHAKGVIHADLHIDNILYTPSFTSSNAIGSLKLIDFSNSILPAQRRTMQEDYQVARPCYRAPEVLLGAGPLSRKLDIWAVGIIALELLFSSANAPAIGDGVEGAELLRPPVNNHEGLVRRLIEIFGSLQCCREGIFWRPVYSDLSVRWGKKPGEKEPRPVAEKKGMLMEVLAHSGDTGLARWLAGMVEVDPRRRYSADDALRDPWPVSTLLGHWGAVLARRSLSSTSTTNTPRRTDAGLGMDVVNSMSEPPEVLWTDEELEEDVDDPQPQETEVDTVLVVDHDHDRTESAAPSPRMGPMPSSPPFFRERVIEIGKGFGGLPPPGGGVPGELEDDTEAETEMIIPEQQIRVKPAMVAVDSDIEEEEEDVQEDEDDNEDEEGVGLL